MTTPELWHGVMYCVGVFVTCNIGGAAVRMAAERAGLLKRRAAGTQSHTVRLIAVRHIQGTEQGTEGTEGTREKRQGQSFEEMQRQINVAERAETLPDADGETAADAPMADANA